MAFFNSFSFFFFLLFFYFPSFYKKHLTAGGSWLQPTHSPAPSWVLAPAAPRVAGMPSRGPPAPPGQEEAQPGGVMSSPHPRSGPPGLGDTTAPRRGGCHLHPWLLPQCHRSTRELGPRSIIQPGGPHPGHPTGGMHGRLCPPTTVHPGTPAGRTQLRQLSAPGVDMARGTAGSHTVGCCASLWEWGAAPAPPPTPSWLGAMGKHIPDAWEELNCWGRKGCRRVVLQDSSSPARCSGMSHIPPVPQFPPWSGCEAPDPLDPAESPPRLF